MNRTGPELRSGCKPSLFARCIAAAAASRELGRNSWQPIVFWVFCGFQSSTGARPAPTAAFLSLPLQRSRPRPVPSRLDMEVVGVLKLEQTQLQNDAGQSVVFSKIWRQSLSIKRDATILFFFLLSEHRRLSAS